MGGVWDHGTDRRWRPMMSASFVAEAELHDLIEQTPSMLPLAGSPRLAVLGREVRCGRGEAADLVAVEVDTGRPVVIEVKLASNTDRRRALTQVLGYAAYLRRLDVAGFSEIVRGYLTLHGQASITAAAQAAVPGDAAFSPSEFESALAQSLDSGRLRAVIALDSAPPELVELVGYLQDVTNDRLSLDLVTVTSYDVGGHRILVPQLVEPDRSQVTARAAGTGKPPVAIQIDPGDAVFVENISAAPAECQPTLHRLVEWARGLERDHLAKLHTSTGKDRWVLNPWLPGQQRGITMIWNDHGAYLTPYRTVLEAVAPTALARLDRLLPGQIGQGKSIKEPFDDSVLSISRDAYAEAASATTPGQ